MGKNPRWGSIGILIPAGDGDRGKYFPRNGERGGDGGLGYERGRGRGLYLPSPTRPVAIPSNG